MQIMIRIMVKSRRKAVREKTITPQNSPKRRRARRIKVITRPTKPSKKRNARWITLMKLNLEKAKR